ncbi:MAG: flagellar hook-basal body complex protein [Candidatus Adiutrix sp.]|jgi:flagellar hook-basal body protein|nr:flagellar hook-basal body complex protein [Candidatus Adiutrix sp.]
MAISSAMYAAVTGLQALGTGMQTISNNIANVNTVGFKAGRTNYEDLISQNYYSSGRINQRGCGVKVSSIQSMFTQGAFMTSAQDTDMAIAGEGFFAVRHAITNEIMYTRAGNFTLNKDGYMEDPSGSILQGWQMSIPKPGQAAVKIGAPTDIKITVLNAPPVETSQAKVVVNLNADDKPAFTYEQYEMAAKYADEMARPLAEAAASAAANAIYPLDSSAQPTAELGAVVFSSVQSVVLPGNTAYSEAFIDQFSAQLGVPRSLLNADLFKVVPDSDGPLTSGDHQRGYMTQTEYDSILPAARADAEAAAAAAGAAASAATYPGANPQPSAPLVPGSTVSRSVILTNYSAFDQAFVNEFKALNSPAANGAISTSTSFRIAYAADPAGTPPTPDPAALTVADRNEGWMTSAEFTALCAAATTVAQTAAADAALAARNAVYPTTAADQPVADLSGSYSVTGVDFTNNQTYDDAFIAEFYNRFNLDPDTVTITKSMFRVLSDGTKISEADRARGYMTQTEFNSIALVAKSESIALARAEGQNVRSEVYDAEYKIYYGNLLSELGYSLWMLEGNGYADAWDASRDTYIDPENYTHMESLVIYDSLGSEHTLNIYYQKNPHMANIWDYIITCDPQEDARKDASYNLLFEGNATFSGLIQKGKITFTSDGDDRHGGVVKDIEAQNLDLSRTLKSMVSAATASNVNGSISTHFQNATIGGYYTGSPELVTTGDNAGLYASSARAYEITYVADVGDGTEGFRWTDSTGYTSTVPISDANYSGPYNFGSGLSITFDPNSKPMKFKDGDTLTFTAHSEQMAWTNLETNLAGYFDFDVAFVQSASMALHPPYPEGMPTIIQNVAFDMGARRNKDGSDDPKWILDELSTTQYASKSSTVFNSQDGYPAGSLQRISIGEDGVVTGVYTNGRQQALYQIGLTRFLNPWGLTKQGDNLFSESRYSGAGALNEPGYGGTGTILGNFLEQSNVDLSEEIVNMIVTQRGFQANSKTVTTTDTMMAEVIEMKR